MKGMKVLSNGVKVINCTPHLLRFVDGSIVEPSGFLLQAKLEEKIRSENPIIAEIRVVPTPEGSREVEYLRKYYPEAIILGSAISAQAYPGQVKMVCLTKNRADVREKVCRVDKFNVYPRKEV